MNDIVKQIAETAGGLVVGGVLVHMLALIETKGRNLMKLLSLFEHPWFDKLKYSNPETVFYKH